MDTEVRLPSALWFWRIQRLHVALNPLRRPQLVELVRAINTGYGYGWRIPTSGRANQQLVEIIARHVVAEVAYDFRRER